MKSSIIFQLLIVKFAFYISIPFLILYDWNTTTFDPLPKYIRIPMIFLFLGLFIDIIINVMVNSDICKSKWVFIPLIMMSGPIGCFLFLEVSKPIQIPIFVVYITYPSLFIFLSNMIILICYLLQNRTTTDPEIDPDLESGDDLFDPEQAILSNTRLIRISDNHRTSKDDGALCAICFGEYRRRERITILPCGHSYHLICAQNWFKISSKCPESQQPIQTAKHILHGQLLQKN